MKPTRVIVTCLLAVALTASALSAAAAAPRRTLAKCAPGRVTAHESITTSHGTFLIEGTEQREFEDFVCTISPTFQITKQNGVELAKFGDGTTFKTDTLGHVFYNLYPGQIKGVGVIVLNGRRARQLGIYAGGQILRHKNAPFAIRKSINDCNPSCAAGHVTYKMLTWHPKTHDYRAKG